jgi:hypothetical protein
LVCFQRERNEAVPGCVGQDSSNTDFCILDPAGDATATSAPTLAPFETLGPSDSSTALPLPPLTLVGNGAALTTLLNECEGDCDSDGDCADNLVCFQRDQNEEVPWVCW